MQTRLNERMIEHGVVFAAGHKGETSHVGEHGPGAILSIEPQQGALLGELVCREIATDGREAPLAVPFGSDRCRGCQTCRADFQLWA